MKLVTVVLRSAWYNANQSQWTVLIGELALLEPRILETPVLPNPCHHTCDSVLSFKTRGRYLFPVGWFRDFRNRLLLSQRKRQ